MPLPPVTQGKAPIAPRHIHSIQTPPLTANAGARTNDRPSETNGKRRGTVPWERKTEREKREKKRKREAKTKGLCRNVLRSEAVSPVARFSLSVSLSPPLTPGGRRDYMTKSFGIEMKMNACPGREWFSSLLRSPLPPPPTTSNRPPPRDTVLLGSLPQASGLFTLQLASRVALFLQGQPEHGFFNSAPFRLWRCVIQCISWWRPPFRVWLCHMIQVEASILSVAMCSYSVYIQAEAAI